MSDMQDAPARAREGQAGRHHGHGLPLHTWVLPVLGLLAYLLLPGGGGALVGLLLAAALLGSVLAAVHHAEVIALRVGEPYGTLVLALAVTVIEVALIVSIMLSGEPNPALARDSVHAVLMLVLHGLAGTCIVVGTLRHREQEFQTYGAQAYLAVLIPMSALVLVLPNYTTSTSGPYYTPLQLGFVSVVCLALYAVFLFVQTVRHRDYFLPPGDADAAAEEEHAAPPPRRVAALAFGLLLLALGAVVLLAKALAPFIQAGVSALGAPVKLVGIIVAAIVLMPESTAAIRAARRNLLQNSINLALGSGVASIALTIPAVSAVATFLGQPLALGVDAEATMLLALSFIMAMLTYGQGRTNLLAGFVHLVLFATYLFMVFAP